MSLMDRASAALNARMKAAAGRSVKYTPKGGVAVPITAWLGNTLFARNPTEEGPAVTWGEIDYLITVADFIAAGLSEPQIGDRICDSFAVADAFGSKSVIFELMPPDVGEPAWRFSDQTRTRYRLHMKRVDS